MFFENKKKYVYIYLILFGFLVLINYMYNFENMYIIEFFCFVGEIYLVFINNI